MKKRYVSRSEAARMLGVSPGKLRWDELNNQGLPFIRWPGSSRILYDVEDIQKFVDRHKVGTIDTLKEFMDDASDPEKIC